MGAPDLPLALGPAPAHGNIRVEPADFVVDEVLGFAPDGNGAHLMLHVEKQGANTGWVATQIARMAGIAPRDVGYCGLKDRHATTRQWYSVPWALNRPLEPAQSFSGPGFRVLQAARHGRKLRHGAHAANSFVITVRELAFDSPAGADALERRLTAIATGGVPNYFGVQRFGRAASNLSLARDWAAGGAAPRERPMRGFALSAARSAVFNSVLAARVRAGNWNRLLPGEAVMLEGSRSFFRASKVDAELLARLAQLDVHPSGPLWGQGASPATDEALAAERAATDGEPALCALLETAGLDQERRALRLVPRNLSWSVGEGRLRVQFELPRGAFATAVLHELIGPSDSPDDSGEA